MSFSDSHLVTLTELKTEFHQVPHPDKAVRISVTYIENLLESPQKQQELLLVRENTSFHRRGLNAVVDRLCSWL